MRTLTPKERSKIETRISRLEQVVADLDKMADDVSAELDRIVDQSHHCFERIEKLLDRLAEDDLARGK
jgi:chaperonin cofactor prefoldin